MFSLLVPLVTGGIVIAEVRGLLERVPNAWLEKPIDVEGLRDLIRRRMRSATAGHHTAVPAS